MRMSSWTPEVMRFMEDASAFTPYFDTLASLVREHPGADGRVCDAGCGLGQLSVALALHAKSVDAVDRSREAIGYVRRRIAGIPAAETVHPIAADVASLKPREPYDLMVFCLSAAPEEAWRIARTRCRGTLLVINKVQRKMRADRALIAPEKAGKTARPLVYDFGSSLEGVRMQGLVCEGRELTLEFGQPFRSLDDAQRYFDLFRTRSYPNGASKRDLEEALERTGDSVFPYYLPVRRHLAVFAIDVPASLARLHDADERARDALAG